MICILSVEGVLADAGGDIRQVGSSSMGRTLYGAFQASNLDICLISTNRSNQVVIDWLTREGFRNYSMLLTADGSVYNGLEFKRNTVQKLLADGQFISFMLDSDPDTVAEMVTEVGVNALLYIPSGAKPGRLRADLVYTPWTTIEDTVEQVKLEKGKIEERRLMSDV